MSVFNLYPTIKPTLSFDFVNAGVLDPSVTFTRTTSATYFDETGILRVANANTPRLDYDPATLLARGLLIEEARTNSIRNNTMQGAVAGTPGTLPTNWSVVPSGLTQTIVGTGTSAGVTYIDIRVNGTTTGAGGVQIKPDGNAGVIAATAAQAWAMSSWVAIVGGSTANTTGQRFVINEYSAGPTYLRTAVAATNILAGGATLTRVSGAITTGASTTILEPIVTLDAASGVAIDITLRIGLPQLELGAFATSVIPTTTTALTRSADVASVNTLTPWFNASAGTLFAEWVTAANDATNNRGIAALDDGSSNNRAAMFVPNSFTPLAVAARVVSGGTATNPANAGSIALSSIAKSVLTYGVGTDQAALCVNGATPITASPAASPVGISVLRIGAIFGVTQLGGWVRRITYYPVRLSNAQLQNITA